MEQSDTKARTKVARYTASLIMVLSSFLFFLAVPFLPDPPFIPLLVALALGVLSFRSAGASVTLLYLLVFISILWQLIGFGFFQLLTARVGFAVLAALILPLLIFLNKRIELTSMSLAVLCVSLMFTPAYFMSIPVLAAAAAVTGFASLEATAAVFILFLAPFLFLDNALFFVTSAEASTPIIFGQLTYLSSNLRPPLPGLNIFLTPLPINYISPQAQAVSTFLINEWALLVIPLLLMGVIIFICSFVGGLIRSLPKRAARFRDSKRLARIGAPLAISLVVPVLFVSLLVPFSFPGAGGFQTSLTFDASHLQVPMMLAGSVMLGGVFTARESLIRRMESVELGRENLDRLLKRSRSSIEIVRSQLKEVARRMPWLDVSAEDRALSEYTSYLDDVQKKFGAARPESFGPWTDHIEKVIIPSLGRIKDRLTSEVTKALKAMGASTVAANKQLEDASVAMRYSQVPEVPSDASLEEALELYVRVGSKIEKETLLLFDAYRSAFESFNKLMDLPGTAVLGSPSSLLDSRDYAAAMRFVGEECWLNFDTSHRKELEAKKSLLLEQLSKLKEFLAAEQAKQLEGILESVKAARPADAAALIGRLEEAKALLVTSIEMLEGRANMIEKTLVSIGPQVSKAMLFQTSRRINEIGSLKKSLESTRTTLDGLTKLAKTAVPVISALSAAWKTDEENLRLLGHYPAARNVIKGVLSERRKVKVESLPYQKRAASLYARLYASENPKSKFDEKEEVLASGA